MSYSIGDGLASIALIGGLVGYAYIVHRNRLRRLELIHEERMAAMEKGIPLPEFPLEPDRAPRPGDDTVLPILGIVLFTLSVGAMVVLYLSLPSAQHSSWIAPLPFGFLGIGLFAFHFMNRESRR